MIRNQDELLSRVRAIHTAIRDTVVDACERNTIAQMAMVVADNPGDTTFAIDRISEEVLIEQFSTIAQEWSCILIAEGLAAEGLVLPAGTRPEDAELRIIVDPIDGTRGLMYQKRSAWILTGIAPNYGPGTSLADIALAVQTEIPIVKQHLCDSLWAVDGEGVGAERLNRISGVVTSLRVQPSRAQTIAQGYGGLARFIPGARSTLAAIDDRMYELVLGPVQRGKAQAFEDQYISSGGQLYELLMGHDRWIADLRPLAERVLKDRGLELGLCCHPYDLCTELIAREAGIVITDEQDRRLQAPLDLETNVAWIGYANPTIRDLIRPALEIAMREQGIFQAEPALG